MGRSIGCDTVSDFRSNHRIMSTNQEPLPTLELGSTVLLRMLQKRGGRGYRTGEELMQVIYDYYLIGPHPREVTFLQKT